MSHKLKIAVIWEQAEWGGVDSYLDYLLNSWPSTDHSFIVIHNSSNKGAIRLKSLLKNNNKVLFKDFESCFNYHKSIGLLSKLAKIANYSITPLLFICSILKYRKLFTHEKYDIVLGQNGGYPGSYGVLSSMFGAKMAGVKVRTLVIHHAAVKANFMHGWFRIIMERSIGRALTSLVAVSQVTKDTLIRNTYITDTQQCHVVVIDNGVPKNSKMDIIKKNNNGKFTIGMLGRLESYKGHDDLLCGLSLLPQDVLGKINVKFIGAYSEDDYERVQDLINKLHLQDVVKIDGYVDEEITNIIADLDLLAMLTKTFEGFGLSIIEALHQNVPVLATNVGVIPELYPSGGELIVDVGDYDGIAHAIKKVVSNKDHSFIDDSVKEKLYKYDSKYMSYRYHQHLMFEYNKVTWSDGLEQPS
jgi:glycosyltransferase involved in cell wall biosynthesis